MKLYPDNARGVGYRRRRGDGVLALAVCVDLGGAGIEWKDGEDTDWIGIVTTQPVASYDYACAAGLVCVVFASHSNKRAYAMVNELYRAGALAVWLDMPDGVWRVCRPQVGKPVVAYEGPLKVSQVLSQARVLRLARGGVAA